jgi:hypothetical protein
MKTLYSIVSGFAVLVVGCNTPKAAHERRMKQAQFEHEERLQQIRLAKEEADAAEAAGVKIAAPSLPTEGQAQPTMLPARHSGQSTMSPARHGGQPTWIDGAGVSRLRPNRSFGSGAAETRRPQPVWIDGAGVSRLAPARQNR